MEIITNRELITLIKEDESKFLKEVITKARCYELIEKLACVKVTHTINGNLDEIRKLDTSKTLVSI
jgi:hypothetical protein